jgi:hypothetical protein
VALALTALSIFWTPPTRFGLAQQLPKAEAELFYNRYREMLFETGNGNSNNGSVNINGSYSSGSKFNHGGNNSWRQQAKTQSSSTSSKLKAVSNGNVDQNGNILIQSARSSPKGTKNTTPGKSGKSDSPSEPVSKTSQNERKTARSDTQRSSKLPFSKPSSKPPSKKRSAHFSPLPGTKNAPPSSQASSSSSERSAGATTLHGNTLHGNAPIRLLLCEVVPQFLFHENKFLRKEAALTILRVLQTQIVEDETTGVQEDLQGEVMNSVGSLGGGGGGNSVANIAANDATEGRENATSQPSTSAASSPRRSPPNDTSSAKNNTSAASSTSPTASPSPISSPSASPGSTTSSTSTTRGTNSRGNPQKNSFEINSLIQQTIAKVLTFAATETDAQIRCDVLHHLDEVYDRYNSQMWSIMLSLYVKDGHEI